MNTNDSELKKQSNDFRFVTSKYRADIDGLRGVAILSVLIFHTFPSLLKGGFIGVDIFLLFLVFLISNIIFESLDEKKFSFANFYTRRIKRIFPALLLVLIFCLIFGWIVLLSDEYASILMQDYFNNWGKINIPSIFYNHKILK